MNQDDSNEDRYRRSRRDVTIVGATAAQTETRKEVDRALKVAKRRSTKQRRKDAKRSAAIAAIDYEQQALDRLNPTGTAETQEAEATVTALAPVTVAKPVSTALVSYEVGNYYIGPPPIPFELFSSQLNTGMEDIGTLQFQIRGRTVATLPYWSGSGYEADPKAVQYMTKDRSIRIRMLTGRTGGYSSTPNSYGAPPVSSPYALPPIGSVGPPAITGPGGPNKKGWDDIIVEGLGTLNDFLTNITDGMEEMIFGQTFDDWLEGF